MTLQIDYWQLGLAIFIGTLPVSLAMIGWIVYQEWNYQRRRK